MKNTNVEKNFSFSLYGMLNVIAKPNKTNDQRKADRIVLF